jgi:hydrogenase nickel incorporation protein HypA/HybF
MHELAITQSMLDIVLRQAERAGPGGVRRVNVVVGQMSGVVAECMQFYFDLLSKGTIAEGADVSVRTVPATARCRACGKSFELKEFSWTCPGCQATDAEIIAGKELSVESIEVE